MTAPLRKRVKRRDAIGRASLLHLARPAAGVALLRGWRGRLPESVRFEEDPAGGGGRGAPSKGGAEKR